VALLLDRRGVTRVHPLEGGIARWMTLGFPITPVPPPGIPAVDPGPPSHPA
jgi:hypothetical protein